ncbi:hypothetical protein CS063_12090 [Sporanaerobium hydrogeniformans]|uniref:Uncharacterized protein n=1 Tax=Sporanaerobium hydrogeniformans TaxID=3072179 RepID=A0AC61DAW6_9FIRM|nr:zinc dependent phospholipase C family protein [Sporanaerobium hydrogeniformans]PHV70212.1 hypothetical protein CS063_12090 [Sporanaerobium hydrogeniformans]
MPDIITHYLFGLNTTQNLKHSPLHTIIKEHPDLFFIGLQGPDFMYYALQRQKLVYSHIGLKMHTEKTGEFIISALSHLKRYEVTSKEFNELLSYMSGFLCHYILDSMAHPYIFYLGGYYLEDTPETKKYEGLHKKIELAIDTILLEQRLSKKAHQFNINKYILSRAHLPSSLLTLYDETLFLLYGINNGGAIFKKSYEDTRLYYRLTSDSLGAKKTLLSSTRFLLPKAVANHVHYFSYYNCVDPLIDYLNSSKRVWLHPVTGNVYTFSFHDILRNATKKSITLLQATYDFVNSTLSYQEFKELLPNLSYLTGLPTTDTRPMKYVSTEWNHL